MTETIKAYLVHVAVAMLLLVAVSTTGVARASAPDDINFETVSGPSYFSEARPLSMTIDDATFAGGTVLTDASYMPVDESSYYGTAFFCNGCSPTISINFHHPVSHFSAYIVNGQVVTVTYTVLDSQGHAETLTLQPNFLFGAGTVTIPDTNITQVTISGNDPAWDFGIDNVSFVPTEAVLIDPVAANLLKGSSVTTNPDVLASALSTIKGVSADGVTQAVVAIPAGFVGEELALSLTPNGSTEFYGGLARLGASTSSSSLASNLTVTAVETSSGPMAFAIYRAPLDFTTGSTDDTAASREVTLQIESMSTSPEQQTLPIEITRPPVVFVHGLWDRSTTWKNFSIEQTSPPIFFKRYVNYDLPVSGISSSDPSYTSTTLSKVAGNALGFAYNAPKVFNQIQQAVSDFRKSMDVAAVQADVVAHSMGGDISRAMVELPKFRSNDSHTYGEGPIHKLITIGTPHLGSPLAIDLLKNTNTCVRKTLASNGNIALKSVTINGKTIAGAVGDLQGNGTGGSLSVALLNFPVSQPFPTAYIVGEMTSDNLSGLGCTLCAAGWIRFHCGGDPLADSLTAKGWPAVFGQQSDSVVPLLSEDNNGSAVAITGVIHSDGMKKLNFNGPSELDGAPFISNDVVKFLNEPTTGPNFRAGQ